MVEHIYVGEDERCQRCGQSEDQHRVRREHLYIDQRGLCLRCGEPESKHREVREDRFMGIDGEGQNDTGGRHRYMTMACVDEDGKVVGELKANMPRGLGTEQCFEWLLGLPTYKTKCFAYSFGYDLTKILEDLDDRNLYRLFRPDTRKKIIYSKGRTSIGFVPVFWKDYKLTYLNGQFSVARCKLDMQRKRIIEPDGMPLCTPPLVIHDIWRFFGTKFTSALEDWKVGTKVELEVMREMKDKRAEFDKLDPKAIREYCMKECQFMAQLAVKLRAAHQQAGIPLRSWFGAGSTAGGLLEIMGIREHLREWKGESVLQKRYTGKRTAMIAPKKRECEVPEAMQEPIACAFFGGRFENSVIGPVKGLVHSYDISSAYPYQCCFLPCLIHSRWEHVAGREAEKRAWEAPHALVRYTLHAASVGQIRGSLYGRPKGMESWGPLPFRMKNGSICFPGESDGGWVWRSEFFAARKCFENLEITEAWIYHADCACRPFERMPQYYRERVRIGKEGPGIVIKLGCNSVYGKCAQSSGGGGTYTCWIWAGMITSGCRAQGLDVMALHKDLSNLLMIATDGIATREELTMPAALDTGTGGRLPCPVGKDSPEGWTEKPLGGWEYKPLKKGLFLARPGIYFPLQPTKEEIKLVRARGVGRGVVFDQWQMIVGEFEKAKNGQGTRWEGTGKSARVVHDAGLENAVVRVKDLSRFIGAKTGVNRSGQKPNYVYKRSVQCGQWIVRPVEMTFNPLPKREGIGVDGSLGVRRLPGLRSIPYDPATISPEAQRLKDQMAEAEEQPDGGDYSFGDSAALGV